MKFIYLDKNEEAIKAQVTKVVKICTETLKINLLHHKFNLKTGFILVSADKGNEAKNFLFLRS